jgi:hypothetical protein
MSLSVIVPVMKRPQNAVLFMRSLRRTDAAPRTVYAVCDEEDEQTIAAWAQEGAVIVISRYGSSFPRKAQYAYEEMAPTTWVFLCGDDVSPKDGWWREAMKVAEMEPDACLISTNDLHNPFVTAGIHATHPIIKTSWIDECGASWDGPGSIAHMGYHHAYVDNEWTEKAKMDDVFAPALASIVEHRHPTWGTAPWDDTYGRGIEKYAEDGLLFETRLRAAKQERGIR